VEHPVSLPPEWYLGQAATYYARAEECRRLARELELSPLPDLLAKAGADTWQCPAAEDFREQVLIFQGQILDAIATLEANAYRLTGDGDEMTREAAVEAERRRRAAEAAAAGQRGRERGARVAD
jgi:hypothetical protein